MTQVGFCTTCKGRTQHIEETLPANLKDNPGARFTLVNYNSPDHLDDFIKKRHMDAVEDGRLSVYRFTEPGAFRMAHAKNLAHRLALLGGANILVNLDADNFAGEGFAEYATAELSGGDAFLWAHMRKGEMRRGISGRIAVTQHAFLAAGGYDEFFATWSPDDKDFNLRLRRLGFEPREIDKRFLNAINHNDKMRFREYPDLNTDNAAEDFLLPGREHIRVANAGSFGLGVVYKNFGREPMELHTVPTRIFGIGTHKTATTSLHRALLALGYDSAHWKSAHWAKAIWDEMKLRGSSPTLERSYALCDLPISILFRELDKAYPGSKFILTVRDEDEWIESIRTHWSDVNPFRAQWDHDPFTHQIHLEIYGRKKFDEQVMRERYRRHNAEVIEHFKNRPRDLLVMNMSAGAGWYELCGFLRQTLPDIPYPKENKAREVSANGLAVPAQVVWLTGLSGSGKTTIAQAVASRLKQRGQPVEVLDGDALRTLMPTGFSREEREAHAHRVAFMASRLAAHCVTPIVALVSPYKTSRAHARSVCKRFIEVYVSTSLEVCEGRDPKGLYARARAGLLREFTGIDDPYEAPEAPDLELDTSSLAVADAASKVVAEIDRAQG